MHISCVMSHGQINIRYTLESRKELLFKKKGFMAEQVLELLLYIFISFECRETPIYAWTVHNISRNGNEFRSVVQLTAATPVSSCELGLVM